MSDLFSETSKKPRNSGEYTAHDIEVLEGLEPVRRRPGMYIGGIDENALHHLVSEVFDNSMDEVVAGYATEITMEMLEDGSITISDNGRGIPVDPHPKFPKQSALEVILTTLHSGGKFSNKVYYTSGGLHGVGISVVNALSDKLIIEVRREGKLWRQEYSKGAPTTPLKIVGDVAKKNTGTTVTFHPDPEIFVDNPHLKPARLYRQAKSKAYLFKGVNIKWKCPESLIPAKHDVPTQDVICFPGGLVDYLKSSVTDDKTVTTQPFSGEVKFADGPGKVEWAIHWVYLTDSSIQSFCNTVPTPQGGTHEIGLKAALLRSLRDYGELSDNKKSSLITGDDVLGNVTGILSLFISEPQFQGQTKDKLSNREAAKMVENAVKDRFDHWLTGNKQQAEELLGFIIDRAEERISRKQAKDITRKSVTQKLRLPGKLADCTRQTPGGTEIFLVEGDSAGGSAKMARVRETQAILPLRGKILNVASATIDKISGNQEIADLALALGCGVGNNYDNDKLRYEKVIIMTDADVDGAHIASLLMTYFYKFMPKLIENGHLFLAQPPLFRLTQGSSSYYAAAEKEKNALVEKLSKGKGHIEISRFKGLGEMTPPQLRETTMDVKKRTLLKVMIGEEGEARAAERVEELMGKKPELRFKFITEQSELMAEKIKDQLDV